MSKLSLLANVSSETYVRYPDWHRDDESVDNNGAAADDDDDGGDDGDGDGGDGHDDDGSDDDGDDTMMVMMKLPQFTRLSSSLKQWVWLCLWCQEPVTIVTLGESLSLRSLSFLGFFHL